MRRRVVTWLLSLAIPSDEREDQLGDLLEEHGRIRADRGPFAAGLWVIRQAVQSAPLNLLRKDAFAVQLSDLRYAIRVLGRAPGYTIPVILTLALGYGAVGAVLTAVSSVVLRPLPYPDPASLIRLWDRNEAAGLLQFSVSPANYFAWQSRATTLAAVGAYREDGFTVDIKGSIERLGAARTTASLLDVLGVRPAAGRLFVRTDDLPQSAPVVLLTHALATRLGGPSSVIGQSLPIDGRAHEIVGVLERGFIFPQQADVQLLLPYGLNESNPEAAAHFLRVLARLNRRVTLDQAHAELVALGKARETEAPGSNRGWSVTVASLTETIVGDVRQPLYLLLGAAALLLVLTIASVSGLVLARHSTRESELVLRCALGAGRARIVRQLLAEQLLVTLAGVSVGATAGLMALNGLLAINPAALPRGSEIGPDLWVIAGLMASALVVAVMLAVTPLSRATSGRSPIGAGSRVAGHRTRARSILAAAQVGLAVALVSSAALLLSHLNQLMATDPGFDVEGVLTMEIRPPAKYEQVSARTTLLGTLVEALAAMPGVTTVGATHRLPLSGNSAYPFVVQGRPRVEGTQPPSVNYRAVAGDYFGAMGSRIVAGRNFTPDELWRHGGAAILNRAAADTYFAGEDPLGARLVDPRGAARPPLAIVGIVEDMRELALETPAAPAMYLPYAAVPSTVMTVVLRTAGDPSALTGPSRTAVQRLDPLLAPSRVRTLEEVVATAASAPRFQAALLSAFAGVGLLVAMAATFGVMAFNVNRRTAEIGVRVALGATPSDVFRAVVTPGLRLAALGIVGGIGLAIGIAFWFDGVLFGLDANRPWLLASTAAGLFVVAALATIVPAQRARRIDPVAALRRQ